MPNVHKMRIAFRCISVTQLWENLASQDAQEVFSNSSIYIFRISIFHVATSYINELSAKYTENPSAKRTELSQDLAWAGEVARWLLPTSSSESFSPNEWQPFKGRLCVLVPRAGFTQQCARYMGWRKVTYKATQYKQYGWKECCAKSGTIIG